MRKVSVSIVCFNNRPFLGDCLKSVMEQDYPVVETVLVDNASTDGSAEFVRRGFPSVRVIENDKNYYFAKGQNIGIRNSTGEYVLVLNTDVVLERDFISEAVKAIEPDARVGSVSGKIMRSDGRLIDTAGLQLGRDRRPVERGFGEADTGQFEEGGYVFGAGGAAPLYRREMLEEVAQDGEYFDECFEMYYEDLDLAWRARRAGWLARYAPRAVAYHARGGTAKAGRAPGRFLRGYEFSRIPDQLKARLLTNRYLTMLKNDTLAGFLLHLPFILLYDLKIWAYTVVFAPGAIPVFVGRLPMLRTAWRRRRPAYGH